MATNISTDTVTTSNVVVSPQVNKPGSPTEGQIISGTGTGNIAKGVYRYSGGSWESLDNAQGDLNTLRLIMSTDTNANDFNAAKSSTSVAGNTNAVPHETSTGTGLLGALEIPSTGGDALLTEFDANRVLRYYSAGANNNNDYFGITVDVPSWCRGQNIVVEFQYRTEEASADTSNGDFQFSVWDKSNGVTTTSTNTSAVTAGSAITVGTSTNMAVGDKIWLESGAQSTIGNVAATFTEAYITEIVDATNIKISADYTPATTTGSVVVSGWLSSKTEGLLPSADSDTNKVGKSYSLQVKTAEDTDQIVLWISNKSATTNVIELFFDGILVSANKFLQASSQLKDENYVFLYADNFTAASGAGDKEQLHANLLTNAATSTWSLFGDTPPLSQSKYINIADTGTQTRFKALQDITVDCSLTYTSTNNSTVKIKDSTGGVIAQQENDSGTDSWIGVASSFKLNKNDYFTVFFPSPANQYGNMSLKMTPQTSDVILLESQEEIFTDWVSDGTFSSHVTATGSNPTFGSTKQADDYKWRRVGSNMEIMITYYQDNAGTAGTGNYVVALPSGYAIDTTTLLVGSVPVGNAFHHGGTFSNTGLAMGGVGYVVGWGAAFAWDSTGTTFGIAMGPAGSTSGWDGDTGAVWGDETNDQQFGSSGIGIRGVVSLPIRGWNTNFNPLLSMPLVDFGSFENVYSALIDNNGTATITTESRPFIKTVTRSATGVVAIVFKDDFFTQPPVVTVTPSGYDVGSSDYSASCYSVSSTGVTVKCEATGAGGDTDRDFSIVVQRQGTDYKDPPQATAAVIKPAVCHFSETHASGGTAGTSSTNAYSQLKPNTFKGDTWFISAYNGTIGVGGTNTEFTLDAGMYKIEVVTPGYKTNSFRASIQNVTDSINYDGQNQYAASGEDSVHNSKAIAIFTITSAKAFTIKTWTSNQQSSNGLGKDISQGVEQFLQGTITKYK